MKPRYSLLLVLILALGLSACGLLESSSGNSSLPEPVFTYNDIKITMNAEARPILDQLGGPFSYSETASCAFDGLDKTYYYGSFYMTTCPNGDVDYISTLWFADDSVATAEGICIGSTQEEVAAAYGEASFNGTNAYVMETSSTRLTILLTDGKVSSVQYEAISS